MNKRTLKRSFYSKWEKLESKFTLISTFLDYGADEIQYDNRGRGLGHIAGEEQQIYLTAEDVRKPLGEALKHVRDLQFTESRHFRRDEHERLLFHESCLGSRRACLKSQEGECNVHEEPDGCVG
jgi:hypothetical protein